MCEIEERFWAKVNKNGSVPAHAPELGNCWLWTASTTSKGYGQFNWNGKMSSVHRLSYKMAHGSLPPLLDHKCHVRHCVNPHHLHPKSTKENNENLKGAHKDSASGVRGVYWDKRAQRWAARVGHNYKLYWVGRFDTVGEAEEAVIQKRNELFTNNLADK